MAEHRRARRAAGVVATAVVAVAGGIGLLLFFVARDDAPVDKSDKQNEVKGPGQAFPDLGAEHVPPAQRGQAHYNSNPPTSGPHVAEAIRRDEIVLTDRPGAPRAGAGQCRAGVRLGRAASGPEGAGRGRQRRAVRTRRSRRPASRWSWRAGRAREGIVALAWRHLLRAPRGRRPGAAPVRRVLARAGRPAIILNACASRSPSSTPPSATSPATSAKSLEALGARARPAPSSSLFPELAHHRLSAGGPAAQGALPRATPRRRSSVSPRRAATWSRSSASPSATTTSSTRPRFWPAAACRRSTARSTCPTTACSTSSATSSRARAAGSSSSTACASA